VYSGANARTAVAARGRGFSGYSESLPRTGFTGCNYGPYARRHNPWVDFTNVPSTTNRPFNAFPGSYGRLPGLSWVVPNLVHDMHDGSVGAGDSWLKQHLGGYVSWARTHNSLLVLTWDEDDGSAGNRIATIFVGAHVRPGSYREHVTHYRVLRTIEAAFGARPSGQAANVAPITDVWR
jgi:acid phosphatase